METKVDAIECFGELQWKCFLKDSVMSIFHSMFLKYMLFVK